MVAEFKIEDGFIVEYDEYGNRIRSYGLSPNAPITQIAVDGDWVAAYIEIQNQIYTYRDGMYSGGFNIPLPLKNLRMSGNTVIAEFTNGQIYEYTNEGSFLKGY